MYRRGRRYKPDNGQEARKKLAQRGGAPVRAGFLSGARKADWRRIFSRQKNSPTVQVGGRGRTMANARPRRRIRRVYVGASEGGIVRKLGRLFRGAFYRPLRVGRAARRNGCIQKIFCGARGFAGRSVRLLKSRCPQQYLRRGKIQKNNFLRGLEGRQKSVFFLASVPSRQG